jgi:hypothetical protein
MPGYQKRFLGDLDAATDKSFKNHFVESIDLLRINHAKSDIVYGTKGVGKTALRRALTELNRDSFFTSKTIDLDQISFYQVHRALSDVKETSNADVATLARNTWRNVLSLYCLEGVAETLPGGHELKHGIEEFLGEQQFRDTTSTNNRLITAIHRLFRIVGGLGLDEAESLPPGVSTREVTLMNDLPLNARFRALLKQCSQLIIPSKKVALICLDGFDSIIDHAPESRKAIFAGLIDAIYKFSKDPLFLGAFCFKAFLPQELTEEARTIIWDADKFVHSTHYLWWSEENFKDLLRKRLRTYAKTKSPKFVDIWRDFMPDKVVNPAHKLEESSFGYVLRHTLYRPRQILTHMQCLLDQWDAVNTAFKIDPSFIPSIIARTNYEMAQNVVFQLGITHPRLGAFMKSWSGSPSTIFVGDFLDRITKYFSCQSPQEAGEVFDSLFNFGVFGFARSVDIKPNQRTAAFHFVYVGERLASNMSTSLALHDVVALSPMFSEFCGCTPSEFGIVVPTE